MRNYFGGGGGDNDNIFSGIERGLRRREERQANNLDMLLKQAQLQESGYDLTQKKAPFGGFFGGRPQRIGIEIFAGMGQPPQLMPHAQY